MLDLTASQWLSNRGVGAQTPNTHMTKQAHDTHTHKHTNSERHCRIHSVWITCAILPRDAFTRLGDADQMSTPTYSKHMTLTHTSTQTVNDTAEYIVCGLHVPYCPEMPSQGWGMPSGFVKEWGAAVRLCHSVAGLGSLPYELMNQLKIRQTLTLTRAD